MNFGKNVRGKFHTPFQQYRGFNGRRFRILRKIAKPDRLHDGSLANV